MRIIAGIGVEQNSYDVALDPTGKYVPSRGFDITNVCLDNECIEFSGNIMDYIPFHMAPSFFSTLAKKMRKNGEVNLSGTNINELNRHFIMSNIGDEEYNQAIYNNTFQKEGIYSPSTIVSYLNKVGFNITSIKIDGLSYTVGARRQ